MIRVLCTHTRYNSSSRQQDNDMIPTRHQTIYKQGRLCLSSHLVHLESKGDLSISIPVFSSIFHAFLPFRKNYSSGLRRTGSFLNMLNICTREDPTMTKRRNAMSVLLTGNSSSCSAALPMGTFPRLVTFLSNLELRLRMFLGRA